MPAGSTNELARRLTRALFPEWDGVGVQHSIHEQILADALATPLPPRTLRELLLVLEPDSHKRGRVALEILAALRHLSFKTPDLPLDEFVGRS